MFLDILCDYVQKVDQQMFQEYSMENSDLKTIGCIMYFKKLFVSFINGQFAIVIDGEPVDAVQH